MGTKSNQGGPLPHRFLPSDSATEGEIFVRHAKFLPEALEKFSKCPFTLQLRYCPQLLTSSILQSFDCASRGELPVRTARSLPEALAKFSNCFSSSQMSDLT